MDVSLRCTSVPYWVGAGSSRNSMLGVFKQLERVPRRGHASGRGLAADPATRLVRLLAAGLLLLVSPARAEVRNASFHSKSLGRDVPYIVDLPASYASGTRRYPVVYALHGLFEGAGFWEKRGLAPILDHLRAEGSIGEFLVVAVDGGNSFFVNGPKGAYQDLVSRDIVEYVDATYRTLSSRAGRALLGVSMGGYGALRIAFEDPGRFQAVATHSAMLLEKIPTREEGAGRWHMAAFNEVFGDPIDSRLWTGADPLALADHADARTSPALYFDCGTEDRYGLYAGNRDLHLKLEARHVPHTFRLLQGDHGYEFVRAVLDQSLRFLGTALGAAPSPRVDQ
jgi:S-formylglutathione hydrolase FrmB